MRQRDQRIAVRRADAGDAVRLAALARAHAAYEGLPKPPRDHAARLAALLSSDTAALTAWIAEAPAPDRAVAGPEAPAGPVAIGRNACGYATFTLDVATLSGAVFGHLDCLFVSELARGHGIGARLFEQVRQHAAALGIDRLEWQTPQWNRGARRFYERLGAQSQDKARYHLAI